jgi:hypothetical protein
MNSVLPFKLTTASNIGRGLALAKPRIGLLGHA